MRRTFKDFIQSDITNVFVNQDEFAETVIINNREMVIIRDDDAINSFKTDKQLATYDIVFHVASSYFEYIPQPEMLMEFEGEEYRIKKVSDNMGMLTIALSRNEV